MHFFSLLALSEITGYLALIMIYCLILNGMYKVDIHAVIFSKTNECSDGVLMHSIDLFMDYFFHDIAVVTSGLMFTLISFGI
jgi:hypothetical protein